jgi:type I restriction enzyme S subunit
VKSRTLGDIAQVFNGKTPPKSEQRSEGHPVLKIRDVSERGQFYGRFDSFVDDRFAQRFEGKFLKEDDFLVLNAAHNADYVGSKKYVVEASVERALPTGEWMVVRAKSTEIFQRYLNHWLGSDLVQKKIRSLVKGIHLYPKDVAMLDVPLPSIEEQRRIAAVLDKADAIRRKRRLVLSSVDDFLRSVFLEMFGDPVTNPKQWKVFKFGEICSRVTVGLVVQPASYYREHGIPALRSLNVRQERFDLDDLKYFSEDDTVNKLAKSRVWKDDVVIVRSGQPGTAAVVPAQLDGANAIDILISTPRLDRVVPRYVSAFLNSPAGRRLVLKEGRGQIQKHLNVGSLNKALIPLPPMPLQKRFVNIIQRTDEIRSQILDAVKNDKDFFSSLSQRAFCGDL